MLFPEAANTLPPHPLKYHRPSARSLAQTGNHSIGKSSLNVTRLRSAFKLPRCRVERGMSVKELGGWEVARSCGGVSVG
jgi:hypothetical protein